MVREGYDEGVELGCFEHVSICLQGNADYTLETPNGELIQNWTFGTHNVENGWGYLPKGKFVRTFHDDFVLCCVLQKSDRPQNLIYNFDVLTETRSLVREVEFAHVAYGSMTVDSVQYNQKQSLFNLNSNATLVINSNSIVIIGYKI